MIPEHPIIVLVGLMGAGKSTIGRKLAHKLHVDFKDSDDEIAEAAGCSVSDLFAIHGEAIFRDLEQRVIVRLLQDGTPKVMATGGGAWMNPVVREMIGKHATSIWLRAELDILVERVGRKNTRPLLEKGDKKAILQKLMDERYPIYQEADLVIESDNGAHDSVVDAIIRRLRADTPPTGQVNHVSG